MQWETAAYLALSIITVLVARSGPSRGAYGAAWLLFLSCILNNCAWYMQHQAGAPSLAETWSWPDAVAASLLSVLYIYGDRPRKWVLMCMIIAYGNLLTVHPLYELGFLPRWWYAFILNRGFEITSLAIMTPAYQYYRRRRRG